MRRSVTYISICINVVRSGCVQMYREGERERDKCGERGCVESGEWGICVDVLNRLGVRAVCVLCVRCDDVIQFSLSPSLSPSLSLHLSVA